MSETKEVKSEGEFKLKKKTPKIKGQGNTVPEVTKIDLSKKTEEDAIQVGETETVVDDKQMPFKSEKQKQWLMINKPEIYQKWKKKYGTTPVKLLKLISKKK